MLTEIRLEQIKDHAIVFAVVLEHRFTNRAFEIKANHGKRRKEKEEERERGEGEIMGCQWNDRVSVCVLTSRYANRFDEDRLS